MHTTIDCLLRDRAAIFDRIDKDQDLAGLARVAILAVLAGAAVFGAAAPASATANFPLWTGPRIEAKAVFCERSTTVGRSAGAAGCSCPTSLDNSSNITTPRPKGACRPPFDPLRDAPIRRLAPPLQNAPRSSRRQKAA